MQIGDSVSLYSHTGVLISVIAHSNTVCVQIFVGHYFHEFREFADIHANKNAKITWQEL